MMENWNKRKIKCGFLNTGKKLSILWWAVKLVLEWLEVEGMDSYFGFTNLVQQF